MNSREHISYFYFPNHTLIEQCDRL